MNARECVCIRAFIHVLAEKWMGIDLCFDIFLTLGGQNGGENVCWKNSFRQQLRSVINATDVFKAADPPKLKKRETVISLQSQTAIVITR